MNALLSPAEVVAAYAGTGAKKCALPALHTFLLALLAGALIAFAGAATNTAAHSAGSVGACLLYTSDAADE